MAQHLTLKVIDNGTFKGQFCVYQQDPDVEDLGAMTLAWLTKGAHPNTQLQFDWDVEYNFVWSETGNLKPGVVFVASETLPCDPTGKNEVELDRDEYGYDFANLGSNTDQLGNLIIHEASNLPANEASVGIGMSGFGTFVWATEPSVNLIIKPKPQYWITYGWYKQGQVLDVQQITQKLQLTYQDPNKPTATVELKPDNTWGPVTYS